MAALAALAAGVFKGRRPAARLASARLVAEARASAAAAALTSPAKLEAHRLVSLMRLGDGRVRHDAFLPKDNAPITKNFWFLMRLTASLLIQPRGQAVDTTITVLPRPWAWAARQVAVRLGLLL